MSGADGADRLVRVQGLNIQRPPVPPPKGCLMNRTAPTSSTKITALAMEARMPIIADPLELIEASEAMFAAQAVIAGFELPSSSRERLMEAR